MATAAFLGLLALSMAAAYSSERKYELDGRIGGNETTIQKFPYMASVRDARTGVHICGGSIIAHHWVLTAAQCVYGNLTEMYKVRAGSANINGGDAYFLEQIVIHPNYIGADISSYDIAAVKVVQAFIYSSSVQPVKLAPAGTALAVGTMAAVAGWGATPSNDVTVSTIPNETLGVDVCDHRLSGSGTTMKTKCFRLFTPDQDATDDLLAAAVEVVSGNECSTAYGSKFSEDTMICVNHASTQQGACVNDEGSALAENSIQIGVVSLTTSCYEGPYNRGPGIYTRVSYFTNWIMAETGA